MMAPIPSRSIPGRKPLAGRLRCVWCQLSFRLLICVPIAHAGIHDNSSPKGSVAKSPSSTQGYIIRTHLVLDGLVPAPRGHILRHDGQKSISRFRAQRSRFRSSQLRRSSWTPGGRKRSSPRRSLRIRSGLRREVRSIGVGGGSVAGYRGIRDGWWFDPRFRGLMIYYVRQFCVVEGDLGL